MTQHIFFAFYKNENENHVVSNTIIKVYFIKEFKNKKETIIRWSLLRNQQLPMLPGRFQPSTFGVYELNYCVRHGYRCRLVAIATELLAEFAVCSLKTIQKK